MKRFVLLALVGCAIAAPSVANAKLEWPFSIVVSGGTLEKPVRLPNVVVDALLPDINISALFEWGDATPPPAGDPPFIVQVSMRRRADTFMTLRYHRGADGELSRIRWDNGPVKYLYPTKEFDRALRSATRARPAASSVTKQIVEASPAGAAERARRPVALWGGVLLLGSLGVIAARARSRAIRA